MIGDDGLVLAFLIHTHPWSKLVLFPAPSMRSCWNGGAKIIWNQWCLMAALVVHWMWKHAWNASGWQQAALLHAKTIKQRLLAHQIQPDISFKNHISWNNEHLQAMPLARQLHWFQFTVSFFLKMSITCKTDRNSSRARPKLPTYTYTYSF